MAKYSIDQKADMLKRSGEAEKKASRYASEERVYRNALKGRPDDALGRSYKDSLQAASQMANMAEQEAENLKIRAANSRAQYEYEKRQGDPYATRMSFEEWKNLD